MLELKFHARVNIRVYVSKPVAPVVRCLQEPTGRTLGRAANVTVRAARSARQGDDDDYGDDEEEAPVAGRALRVERLLANLGYGKRRECQVLVKKGRATRRDGGKLKVGDKVLWSDVVLDGEELDPPSPLLVALHKPVGYVVTSPDDENITDPVVYDLLPYRFAKRRPFLSCVGRLDKDTSGLLLLTDDGALLHRINSPRRGIWKVYEATLADPMTPRQAEAAARRFASGALMLEGDNTPLLPAKLEMIGERSARVAICEGRYHQVRRMFAAVGNKVVALHRVSVGGLTLGSLPESEWRHLTPGELQLVFEGPTAEEVLGSSSSSRGGSGSRGAASGAILTAKSHGADRGSGDGDNGASTATTEAAALARDGGADASTSRGAHRLTKKEKKKGPKGATQKKRAVQNEDEEEEEEEEIADVELLAFDDDASSALRGLYGTDDGGEEEGEEGEQGHRPGAQRRRPRRPLRRAATVRQGVAQDARQEGGLDEQLESLTSSYGISYDDEVAEMVASAGAGGDVRKYREGARWRRRRDALRQMLPS